MKNREKKKLGLNRDTVLRLGETDLSRVGGYSPTAGASVTCTFSLYSNCCTMKIICGHVVE
jgi:hypothetical protein